mgnify:FL=1
MPPQQEKGPTMRIVIDISEMAKVLGINEIEVLRQLTLEQPQGDLEEWLGIKPEPTPGLRSIDSFLGAASHFVKRE